jgi:hypothetical protein
MGAATAQTPFVPFAGKGFGPGWVQQVRPQLGQDGKRRHDEGHLAVPGVPGAGLTVIEAEFVPGRREAGLDRPSQPGDAGKFCEANRSWPIGANWGGLDEVCD